MRSALCGPHSRPHASPRWRSRLRLRPRGVLARAWARAVSCVSADFPKPAVRACLPRLPASLQPFPPVSPERGGASRLPRPNNDGTSRPHSRPHCPPNLAPQPGSPATAAPSVAALPMRAPASDVATGAANPFEIARFFEIARVFRVSTRDGFPPRFCGDLASSGPSKLDCGPNPSRNGGFLACRSRGPR
jgi:hypothetical protein